MSSLLQIAKIGHQLDGNLQRYKPVFYFQRYWDYRHWLKQQDREIPQNKPLVVFDFKDTRIDGPQGRRFYCLLIYFIRAGYYPILRENYLFLGNIQEKQKSFCLKENFSILEKIQDLPDEYLLITDKNLSRLFVKASKIIQINYQTDYQPEDSCFPMPFPMFPAIYVQQQDQLLNSFRQQTRIWTIFFGGDAQPDKYNKSSIREIYQKLTRTEIFVLLKQKINSKRLLLLTQEKDLEFACKRVLNSVILMNNRECKVSVEKWLSTLALSQFFLACPGVRYPMSHNLIEAMAVGTIPITQYPELFYPALEHGKNCLVFSDEISLIQVIEKALKMSDTEKQSLKQNTINYYEQWLAPKTTIQRLINHRSRRISLRLLPFLKDGGGCA